MTRFVFSIAVLIAILVTSFLIWDNLDGARDMIPKDKDDTEDSTAMPFHSIAIRIVSSYMQVAGERLEESLQMLRLLVHGEGGNGSQLVYSEDLAILVGEVDRMCDLVCLTVGYWSLTLSPGRGNRIEQKTQALASAGEEPKRWWFFAMTQIHANAMHRRVPTVPAAHWMYGPDNNLGGGTWRDNLGKKRESGGTQRVIGLEDIVPGAFWADLDTYSRGECNSEKTAVRQALYQAMLGVQKSGLSLRTELECVQLGDVQTWTSSGGPIIT